MVRKALIYGVSAPFLIALSIVIGRYWTTNHGYASFDFTIDSYIVMGICEIGLFI